MKALRIQIAALVLGLGGFLAFAFPAQAQTSSIRELRIVFIAYSNPDQLIEDVKPVVDYLKGELKLPVKHFVAGDYAGVVEALRNSSADVGFMGPLQYLLAHQEAGAYPILGEVYNGRPTYLANIFVRKDSGINQPSDLRGKTMAFVDPLSSSGYMYPLDIFVGQGLIENKDQAEAFFKKIYFAGGDEQAISAVLNKFVDAAGVGEYASKLLRPEVRDQVTTIAESRPIPSHCVVVRKDLAPDLVQRLQDALYALNEGTNRSLLKQLYNVDGYVKVNHENYREVEKLAMKYGFMK